jgi:GNAT superfamily N-acetyltransferase
MAAMGCPHMTAEPKIELRAARVEDAASVHGLLLELARELRRPEAIRSTVEDIERFGFDAAPRFEAVLAFSGGAAVGLAVFFYEFSTWRGVPGVYIQDLYVAPGLRGHGVGRRLFDAVRSRAAEWGGQYVKLSVYDGNPRALGFYRRLGFEVRDDEQVLVWRR